MMRIYLIIFLFGLALGSGGGIYFEYEVSKAKILQKELAMQNANTEALALQNKLTEKAIATQQEKQNLINSLENARDTYAKDMSILTKQLANVRLLPRTSSVCGSAETDGTNSTELITAEATNRYAEEFERIIKEKSAECDALDTEFQLVWQPWAKRLNGQKGEE